MKKTTNLLAAALLLPGLVCAPGASAIDTERTTAFSFPCDIVFHAEDGRDLTLDGAEYKTLNYKGRTFVPLRAFAELLGADVAFTGAGADGVNRIDLRLAGKAPAITPERAEAGGLIDLYDLRYDTETSPGEAFLRSGMLRVNGDLDGGAITLWHAGHENVAPLRIPGAHPIVLNETAEPLRAGDIRPFVIGENIAGNILFKVETPPYAYGSESVSANAPGPLLSFSFHPYGYMSLKSVPDFDLGNAWFTLYSPPGEEGTEDAFFRPMRCHRFDCTIASLARDMPADAVLTTEPFGVDLRIYRLVADADGGLYPGEFVLGKELRFDALTFEGEMLFRDSLLWDGLDKDGAPLPAGDYLYETVFPDEIRYSLDGGPVQSTRFDRGTASGTAGHYPFSIRRPDPPAYGNGDTELLLAPTRVRFTFADARLDIPVWPDGILYLDGRTYVPLRLFAESMGAAVTWTPPAETGSGRGRVDIGGLGAN